MTYVYKLTNEQAALLIGLTYDGDQRFNPILDRYNNYVISEIEVNNCINDTVMWVKNLEKIEYKPKTITL